MTTTNPFGLGKSSRYLEIPKNLYERHRSLERVPEMSTTKTLKEFVKENDLEQEMSLAGEKEK